MVRATMATRRGVTAIVPAHSIATLDVLDVVTRECLAIEVDTSLPGQRVAGVIDAIAAERGLSTGNATTMPSSRTARWATRPPRSALSEG